MQKYPTILLTFTALCSCNSMIENNCLDTFRSRRLFTLFCIMEKTSDCISISIFSFQADVASKARTSRAGISRVYVNPAAKAEVQFETCGGTALFSILRRSTDCIKYRHPLQWLHESHTVVNVNSTTVGVTDCKILLSKLCSKVQI